MMMTAARRRKMNAVAASLAVGEKNSVHDWTVLVVGNDWGVNRYMCSGVETLWEDGQPIAVKFPDGSIHALLVKLRRRSVVVADMGHNYSTTYKEPMVVMRAYGVDFDVPLTAVLVCRTSLRFKRKSP